MVFTERQAQAPSSPGRLSEIQAKNGLNKRQFDTYKERTSLCLCFVLFNSANHISKQIIIMFTSLNYVYLQYDLIRLHM